MAQAAQKQAAAIAAPMAQQAQMEAYADAMLGQTGFNSPTQILGAGKPLYDLTLPPPTRGDAPHADGTCPSTEKCSTTELVIGAGLIVVVDVLEVLVLAAAFIIGEGPIGAVAALEVTEIPLVVVNVIGAYLIFDSGEVKGFNRTDWGLK